MTMPKQDKTFKCKLDDGRILEYDRGTMDPDFYLPSSYELLGYGIVYEIWGIRQDESEHALKYYFFKKRINQ